ncbi:glycosyltransferase family 4 protein [Rhodococcus sp. IEGM1428]|uniref:glycosyltransferase family 4 protein n=1 Tax=Rhodococcus sp. IEGM1428 TaxID=3392191 RepID=UPI003D0B3148
MRILLLPTPDLEYESGSTLFAAQLMQRLERRGHDVDVIAKTRPSVDPSVDGRVSITTLPDIPDYPLRTDAEIDSNTVLRGVCSILDVICGMSGEGRPDRIHAFYAGYTAQAALIAKWQLRAELIVSTFGRDLTQDIYEHPDLGPPARAIFAAADMVTVPSEEMGHLATELYGVDPTRIAILKPFVDLSAFRAVCARRSQRVGDSKGRVRLLIVQSAFNVSKGLEAALEAVAVAYRACPSISLTVVGQDDSPDRRRTRDIEKVLQRLEVPDGVIVFVGSVPNAALPDVLADHDVFLDARSSGSFSSSLLEASVSGLVSVVTNIGENREMLIEGTSGELVPVGDIRAFAAAIVRVVKGLVHYRRGARLSSPTIAERYDPALLNQMLDGVYRD